VKRTTLASGVSARKPMIEQRFRFARIIIARDVIPLTCGESAFGIITASIAVT